MQTYYSDLPSIEQQTQQLENLSCRHCQQENCLISHGYIYKKRHCSEPVAVGKRVFCSNRDHHTGCGRTMQLYLDSTIRYLHYAGDVVVAFLLALVAGMTVQKAFYSTAAIEDPRNAYRWLQRFYAQLSHYRSLSHRAPLQIDDTLLATPSSRRRCLLTSTMRALLPQFGESLCQHFQTQSQRQFL